MYQNNMPFGLERLHWYPFAILPFWKRLFTSRFTFKSFSTRRKTGCALCISRSSFIWKKWKGHRLYWLLF